MASFDIPPDWAKGLTERWQFMTDVLVGWNATEQRRKLRAWPRVELEFEAVAGGSDAAALRDWLNAHQSEVFDLPWWPEGGGTSYSARFLERLPAQWLTPERTRLPVKARLVENLPAPAGSVAQIGGHDAFVAPPPDWAQPLDDEWQRFLEVLDLRTGPIQVLDRAGFSRRRWTLEYLVAGADVARLRTFVWRRYGRLTPCWLPAPEGGNTWCRLDMDEIEWRWITPQMCRCTLGVLTLPDEVS
jgi:hypothetical protein